MVMQLCIWAFLLLSLLLFFVLSQKSRGTTWQSGQGMTDVKLEINTFTQYAPVETSPECRRCESRILRSRNISLADSIHL